MQRKSFWTGVFFCLAVQPALAQGSGNLSEIHINRVKPGLTAQYEAARKRHWEWHKKQNDKWSWYTWIVVTGAETDSYVVASFGHDWKDVDVENSALAESPDSAADVDPFLASEEQRYYEYRPDLSLAHHSPSQAPLLSVTQYILNPGSTEDFVGAVKEINKAVKLGHDVAAETSRWYELIQGGESPQFLLASDRANWAAFQSDDFKELVPLLERAYGNKRAIAVKDAFRKAIRATYIESWQYRPDLSLLADSK